MQKGRLSLDIHDNIKLYFSSFMVLDVRKINWKQQHVKLHKVVFLSVSHKKVHLECSCSILKQIFFVVNFSDNVHILSKYMGILPLISASLGSDSFKIKNLLFQY